MTDRLRRTAALKYRDLVNKGIPRKQAMWAVRGALRDAGLPWSKSQVYEWCRKFGIDVR